MADDAARTPVPWSGSYLVVLDRRPFAKSLLKWYGPLALAGYCAGIAVAASLKLPGLDWWLDFWTSVVNGLRQFIPLFDNYEAALKANGIGERVAMIYHLLAFGWIVNTSIWLFLAFTVWHLPREDWIRFIGLVPANRRALALGGGIVFVLGAGYWLIFGFDLVTFQYYRPPITIVACFWCLTMGGMLVQISLQAFKVDRELHPTDPGVV